MKTAKISEAASEFEVSKNTIRRWCQLNDITMEKKGEGRGVVHIDIDALRKHRQWIEKKLRNSRLLADLAYEFDYKQAHSLNQHAKQLRAFVLNDKMYISKAMFARYKGTVSVAQAANHFDVGDSCVRDWIAKWDIHAPRIGVSIRVRIGDLEKAREKHDNRYKGLFTIKQLRKATKGRLTRKILTKRVNKGEYPKITGDDGSFMFGKEDAVKLIEETYSTDHLFPINDLAKTMGYSNLKSILKHAGKSIDAVNIRGRWYVTNEEYSRLVNMRPISHIAKRLGVAKSTIRKWIYRHDISHAVVGDTLRVRMSDVLKLERFEWTRGTTTVTEVSEVCDMSRSKVMRILEKMEVPRFKVGGVTRFTMGQYSDAAIEYEDKMEKERAQRARKQRMLA